MILARKNGWMIAGSIISENKIACCFKPVDSKVNILVMKKSDSEKLFDGVPEAEKWIAEVNEK